MTIVKQMEQLENEYTDNQMEESKKLEISYTGQTDVGLVRSVNEDVFSTNRTVNGELFVVCDGMGGHSRGRMAAITANNHIVELLQTQFFDDANLGLSSALIHANQQIANLNHNKIEFKRMGTTVVTALIRDKQLYFAHVGDSRLYLLRDGELHQLTKDHTYVQQLVDGEIITAAEARNHPDSSRLTQAIGILYSVQPSTSDGAVVCQPDDTFMLCTDGLSDMLENEQIKEILSGADGLQEKTEEFIDAAKRAGGVDNITVVLIRINE